MQICSKGYASPCNPGYYSVCNDTFCPVNCAVCEPGFSCRGGRKFDCPLGTFSEEGQGCKTASAVNFFSMTSFNYFGNRVLYHVSAWNFPKSNKTDRVLKL